MDKQKLTLDVVSAIKQVVDNVKNEQGQSEISDVTIKQEDVIADLGLESLEMLALIDVLERKFGLGYIEANTIQNLTVGELCKKVIWHQTRAEVKQKLVKLLQEIDEKSDYSGAIEEHKIIWDWGFSSIDVQELTLEIETKFEVDLSDCNLCDYTFGEIIDCITEQLQ